MLNMIAGVYPIDEGKIILDGTDISRKPEYARAKYLGRVFQDPMKGTAAGMEIQENLALAYRRGKKRGLKWAIGKDEQVFYKEQLKALDLRAGRPYDKQSRSAFRRSASGTDTSDGFSSETAAASAG